jgi:Reverse transcriptase (RNA-dependent DNA polymerase)
MVAPISRRARPDPIQSFLGPKPRGGWRTFAILSPRDEWTWTALAGRVAHILERRLDPRVAANRTVAVTDGWRLEDLAAARRRARGVAPTRGLLLRTDVEDFYGSITPPILVRALADLGVTRQDSRLAGRMIEGWTESGSRGLPIGPVGSAVLANAVLTSVDSGLSSLHFARWVDDYLIAVTSERAMAGILDWLDTSLDQLHLRRSISKTEVLVGTGGIPWLASKAHGRERVTSPSSSR